MVREDGALWALIARLSDGTPLTASRVEACANVRLNEFERHETFVHYRADGPLLNDGCRLSRVDLTVDPLADTQAAAACSLELSGPAIARDEVAQRYPDLQLAAVPRGRSRDELFVFTAQRSSAVLAFAFKEATPGVLHRVSIRTVDATASQVPR